MGVADNVIQAFVGGDATTLAPTILLGAILGICFGLTGTGGSTFAVPLLVYGLGLAPHRAICTSMIAVGVLAMVRSGQHLWAGTVDARAGWTVGLAGLAGAPVGAWIGTRLSEKPLLLVFAVMAAVAAIRMFFHGRARPFILDPARSARPGTGVLKLVGMGLITGVLAGLLGIAGGFVLVPALVLFGGLEMCRAIDTSMFSIALIGVAAMSAHWLAGQRPPLDTVAVFTVGGLLGRP
jgi:uncharacterized membrane protein YfcA